MAPPFSKLKSGLRFETRHLFLKAILRDNVGCVTADNLAFFPEINVVFNRVKKSGNTSLFLHLSELSGDTADDPKQVQTAKIARSLGKRRFGELACTKSMHSLLCVRCPTTRTLSGFLEKVGRSQSRIFRGYAGFGVPTAQGFEAFVQDISSRTLPGTDRHFWPQSRLMFQRAEAFTHIAKLETLKEDMRAFLEKIGVHSEIWKRMGAPHRTESAQAGKITNASAHLDLITPRAHALIKTIYAEDFEAFDY